MQEQTIGKQIGYKVVLPTGPKAKSFKPATTLALQSIRYRIGQTTAPAESGPCALFATLKQARNWTDPGEMILECEFLPSGKTCLWKKNPPEFTRNSYGRGYHAVSAGTTERYLDECPEGTVLAEAVTPLRIVAD